MAELDFHADEFAAELDAGNACRRIEDAVSRPLLLDAG